jgi:hypothetical protein
MDILRTERPDMISFPMITFWGSPEYIVDGFYMIRDKGNQIPRLFAWGPGYAYATHRPATVVDERGIDLRKKRWIQACELKSKQIYMYHYSVVFPHQVFNKVTYYKDRLNKNIGVWEESVYRRLEKPFRAHNVYRCIGWLERFAGENPAVIREMMVDIRNRTIDVELRDCRDVEKLLSRGSYRLATALLRACAHVLSVQPFYFMYRAYASVKFRLNRYVNASG